MIKGDGTHTRLCLAEEDVSFDGGEMAHMCLMADGHQGSHICGFCDLPFEPTR